MGNINTKKDYVLKELCKYFQTEPNEIFIFGFDGYAGAFEYYGKEYRFFIDKEIATKLTVIKLKNDILQEPELFGDFLKNYVNVLPDAIPNIINIVVETRFSLSSDADVLGEAGMLEEYREAEEQGLEDKMSEILDRAETIVRKRIYREIEKGLTSNPIGYLIDESGYNIREVLELPGVGMDFRQVAIDMVDVSGWSNFWDSYDGNYETTENGVVFLRIS